MGVPAFYRWLSEKYPKVVQDVLEERVKTLGDGSTARIPFDSTKPNPSGLECDNLYIDMNGIIHPCSHPENGPQPATEEEMYDNVARYVDRLFRIVRPRRLLYLAIDGVAPRAKMNQQRSRRFRAAQEAREEAALEEEIRASMPDAPKAPATKPWDSNVITPGTPFMLKLAEYMRFYIRKRIAQDKAWQSIKIVFSDASIPGEGEHKIMSHVRLQRSQPGYNPNLVHVLHGLDADLIMLALATHEAHFYISRELVLFGRKSQEMHDQRQEESGFRLEQEQLDTANGVDMSLSENMDKPLQRVSIPILREYLAFEFQSTLASLPFAASLERLIDDVVFLCFFVGNDFLPHLPSLDIRVGALDYLFNVYKELLPTLGDYLTSHGGVVNLSHVDVLLAQVGAIEDYVFQMKHENELRQEQRRKEFKQRRKLQGRNAPPPPPPMGPRPAVMGRAARILEKQEQEKQKQLKESKVATHMKATDNAKAALALKESLGLGSSVKEEATVEKKQDDGTKQKAEQVEETNGEADAVVAEENGDAAVKDTEDEDGEDDDNDDEEENEFEPEIQVDEEVPEEVKRAFKEKVKAEQQKKLDNYAHTVEDKVRLHEPGWKDRYYTDKCKADDVTAHGGREHLFRSYVMGLCWVMKYYYDGCPSWKWYYPFHYGPFASDLKNIERFEKDVKAFELCEPFAPVEQLMAVLPEDSSHAIPKASRWLMGDPESPIIDFYPKEVPVDPNGKAMPWLWVILLPFIEEERLLAAMHPTMEKWTKKELLCNARGMDDGYLYVYKEHPLVEKISIVFDKDKKPTEKLRFQDGDAGVRGFIGSARLPLSNEVFDFGDDVKIELPATAQEIKRVSHYNLFTEPIENNVAVCVSFSEPAKLSHKSVMLPGARPPPTKLTAQDRVIRRPRLNRGGGTIANMGVSNGKSFQAGYGSMNISQRERDLANRTGRGHQMNQAGTRTWGSMEPTQKRRRQNGGQQQQPPYNPNPFNRPPQQQRQQAAYNMPPWQNQPSYGQQQGYNQGYQQQQQGYNQGYQQQGYGQQGYQPQQNQYGGYQPGYQQQQQGYQQQRGGGHQRPYTGGNPERQPYGQQQQQQQQGYSFQNYNRSGQQNRPPPPPPQQQQSRADPSVISNLRAQLQNTLKQQRNKNNGGR